MFTQPQLQRHLTLTPFTETLLCTLLLFFMAQVTIPLQPIPVTLQSLGVMLVGLKFSRKTAFYSVLTYLSLGAVGFPVLANFTGGYPIFLGPTGGYLIGFLVASLVVGALKERLRGRCKPFINNALSGLAGTVAVFICGVGWLAGYVGLPQAITVGLFPFIIPGLVKIALLVVLLKGVECRKK